MLLDEQEKIGITEVDNASGQVNARRGSEVDADEAANRFPSREEQLAATLATRQSDLAGARDDLVRCSVTSPMGPCPSSPTRTR